LIELKKQLRAEQILRRTAARLLNARALECYVTMKELFGEHKANVEGQKKLKRVCNLLLSRHFRSILTRFQRNLTPYSDFKAV